MADLSLDIRCEEGGALCGLLVDVVGAPPLSAARFLRAVRAALAYAVTAERLLDPAIADRAAFQVDAPVLLLESAIQFERDHWRIECEREESWAHEDERRPA